MKLPVYSVLAVTTLLLSATNATRAGTLWNESQSGDLSNDRLAPTPLALASGSNVLIATSGGPGPDREYFKFTVPPGRTLRKIVLNDFVTEFDGKAFIGIQAGPVITVDPLVNPSPAPLLGYTHFGPDVHALNPPFDYLPEVAAGVGAIGFQVPLDPGEYSVWTQQTSAASPSTYTLDFVVETTAATVPVRPVPFPAWASALLGFAFVVRSSRLRGARIQAKK